MLSCKELLKLINEQENTTFFQRAEMRLHLLMCKHCSNYAKHFQYMRGGFKQLFSKLTETNPQEIERIENEIIENSSKISGGGPNE